MYEIPTPVVYERASPQGAVVVIATDRTSERAVEVEVAYDDLKFLINTLQGFLDARKRRT